MGAIYQTFANRGINRTRLIHVTISRIFINGTIIEFYSFNKKIEANLNDQFI